MEVCSADLSTEIKPHIGWRGVAIACSISLIWALSLRFLLSTQLGQIPPVGIIFAICCQAFLYTGLFITGHDAMHQVVCPSHPKLNHAIGQAVLLLYGFLSYTQLLKRHWQHHLSPASAKDPDFHDGKHTALLIWYARFMGRYWGWGNSIAITVFYHSVHHVFHVTHTNLILFWACPALLSSFQLFYFGTFLPHREPAQGYTNTFRSNSIYRPFWLSLLTCYHFGYHCEHHQYPDVPWWLLPTVTPSGRDKYRLGDYEDNVVT